VSTNDTNAPRHFAPKHASSSEGGQGESRIAELATAPRHSASAVPDTTRTEDCETVEGAVAPAQASAEQTAPEQPKRGRSTLIVAGCLVAALAVVIAVVVGFGLLPGGTSGGTAATSEGTDETSAAASKEPTVVTESATEESGTSGSADSGATDKTGSAGAFTGLADLGDATAFGEATQQTVDQLIADYYAFKPWDLPSEGREVAHEVLAEGSDEFYSTEAAAKLTQAIGTFEDQGASLGFELLDLSSGKTITYNNDEEFYPASAIKAAYCCAVFEQCVETGQVSEEEIDGDVYATIVESDNDAYRSLHNTFGYDTFSSWLADKGVDAGSYGDLGTMVTWNYPMVSAHQMMLMWQGIDDYCSSDNETAQTLAAYLTERETSPIDRALGDTYASWGKAGWFYSYDEDDSAPSAVEGGKVFAGERPYLVVVMSDAAGDLESVAQIVYYLNAAHDAL